VEPEVEPGAIWIHAASLGEGRAAEALIGAIRAARPDREILRTCTSPNARGQRIGADQTACLPVDVPFLLLAWLDRVRPRVLVLVEAELWPGLLWACRRRGVPVVVVGARIGPGLRRIRAIPGLWGAFTRGVSFVPADAATAAVVGGEPIGELKRDAPQAPAVIRWDRPCVIGGSTWEGEEDALLDAVRALDPRPLLVLAPRDPRRFDAVAARLDARGERWVRRSNTRGVVPPDRDVVLLDTLGELAGLYAHASAAFIGGTFDARVGGHSPAEAQAAGCPVVHGPFTEGHAARWAEVESFPALAPEDLTQALSDAMAARPAVPAGGAAARAFAAIEPHLDRAVPPERPLRPWLWPLAPLWLLGVRLRGGAGRRASVPVISVGALTAGGAGKTPVAAWLAARLAEHDPVVVARGYGRRPGPGVRLAGEASEIGDELAMLARRGVRVASAPDRHAGVEAAAKVGARLAILDDSLQYPDITKDLEIVVLDARWPLGGGPIPVGTRRVPVEWLGRADVVWVNHGPLPASLAPFVRPGAAVVEARLRPTGWLYRGERLPLAALRHPSAVAFAGIARPAGFFRLLRRIGVRLDRTWVFPDHHTFVWGDLHGFEAWMDDHDVLTTEKDAARLPPTAQVRALLVEPEIVSGADALEAKLAEVVARVRAPAAGA
jgi:tetraacyldisaccharide 4'-kinase